MSTVHRLDDAHEFACPALLQDHKCLDCRACWDRSVPNVSYQWHRYGATAEADLPAEMNASRKRIKPGTIDSEDKWFLLPEEMELPDSEFEGEEAVLTHPIFDQAFDRTLELFEPKNRTAFLSLCAKSRNSRKWKKYINEFGGQVDLIVCSNATVASIDYWMNCWPLTSYDAGRINSEWDELYVEVVSKRLRRVFETFDYDYVIANFSHKRERNVLACRKALGKLKAQGRIKDFVILPQVHTYMQMWSRIEEQAELKGKQATCRFPDLEPEIWDVLEQQVALWS